MAEKEYIEREALIAQYDKEHVGAPGRARQLMVEAPVADVVEVVRCKDCKYFQTAKVNNKGFLIYPTSGMEITEIDYCSYGERKEESNDQQKT